MHKATFNPKMEPEEIAALEQEHVRGYERQPQTVEEIAEWEDEQVWGEYEPEETE